MTWRRMALFAMLSAVLAVGACDSDVTYSSGTGTGTGSTTGAATGSGSTTGTPGGTTAGTATGTAGEGGQSCSGDTGSYVWADDFGDSLDEYTWGLGVDAEGNVAIGGYWVPENSAGSGGAGGGAVAGLDLGCGELAFESLTTPYDAYVGKLAATHGGCLWSRSILGTTGTSSQQLWNAAVDSAGNVVVAGSFDGDIDFDADGTAEATAAGDVDAFVARYASVDGALQWWKTFGAADGQVAAYGVTVDADDNPVVVGHLEGADVDFGSGSALSPEDSDAFVVRLAAANGDHLHSTNLGGSGYQSAVYVAVDSADQVVVAGQDHDADYEDYGDILVFRLSADLSTIHWQQLFGNDDGYYQWPVDIDTLADGDVIVAGGFQGGLNLGTTPLTAEGEWSAFAGRLLSADGSEVWASNWGASGLGASVASMAVDGCDRIVLGGGFYGTIDFGGSAGIINSGDEQAQDAFIVKLDADGFGLWAHRYGDDLIGASTGQGIERVATNADGDIGLAGYFYGTLDLGGGDISCATCNINGVWDEFVGGLTR